MNTGHIWSAQEISTLTQDYKHKSPHINKVEWCLAWGQKHGGLSVASVNSQISRLEIKQVVGQSVYPIYNEPLVMEGDALVLPDLEIPFHCADFINHCLELADSWNIKQAILAGDVLHFDSLSGWEPNWAEPNIGGLTADAESALMEFAKSLPSKRQGEMMGLLGDLGQRTERDGISTELGIARKELKRLAGQFDRIHYILGNHEGRLLRALQTAIDPQELLRLLETGDKWKISPYYFSELYSGGEKFHIEHPKNAAKFSASKLVSKYLCHTIMCHSHQLNFTFDPSGKYYAIETGMCVDEERLCYVAQRHNTSPMHALGAVIVSDGIPWLLHARTDWERMKNL